MAGVTGSVGMTVIPQTAANFTFGTPASGNANEPFAFALTARDSFGNIATGYGGTVHLTSSDGQALLSRDTTLVSGVGFLAASLRTAGTQNLMASDTANPAVHGTSAGISVAGLAASRFVIAAPVAVVTGQPLSFTIQAQDAFGNIDGHYAGTVHFSSSDLIASLPPDSTLTAGSATLAATFNTPGSQTIRANDSAAPSISGTSGPIVAKGLAVTSFTPTPTGFVVAFNKPFDPTVLNLYDANGILGAADIRLTGPSAPQISFHGSIIIDPSNTTLTFVKTSTFNGAASFNPASGLLAAGTYTATLRSAQNGFRDLAGGQLDGGAGPGSSYSATFVVAAPPTVVIGIPGFARGPDSTAPINLPNNQSLGIPVNITNSGSVTSGLFTLQYNPALLSVTAATVNSGLAGASMSLASASTPGNAIIQFASPSPLQAAALTRLGSLSAIVPNSAAPFYTTKALLHFTGVSFNSGAISTAASDAIELVAYLGDVNADGAYSGGDGSLISRVATGTDTSVANAAIGGFAAYRLADPVLVGDLSNSGSVNATSVTLINSLLSGTPRPQIPSIPTGLVITPVGPDPVLSIGQGEWSSTYPGTLVVTVNIDTPRPLESSGMTEAVLALHFDPQAFTVSNAGIQLGSVPLGGSGWQLWSTVNTLTGDIGVDLVSAQPIDTTTGGSLLTLTLQRKTAAPLTLGPVEFVQQVNPTGTRLYRNTVNDVSGPLVVQLINPSSASASSPIYNTESDQNPTPVQHIVDQVFANLAPSNASLTDIVSMAADAYSMPTVYPTAHALAMESATAQLLRLDTPLLSLQLVEESRDASVVPMNERSAIDDGYVDPFEDILTTELGWEK
jgi:hypothetical protein